MRIPRIYQPGVLSPQQVIALSEEQANHVGRVLRMEAGDGLVLFNGDGFNYPAVITETGKKSVQVQINEQLENSLESPLKIHLGQGISRGDRMDFAIQKAVELGDRLG